MKREAPKRGEFAARSHEASFEKDASRARTVRFIASNESTDRYGDIIRVAGWQIANFAKNPVLLFGHQSRALPIGTASVWLDHNQKALMADATFHERAVNEFADDVFKLVDAGGLRAVSVGFMPTEAPNYIWAADDPKHEDWPIGYEFIAQDLLELSVVSVPANAEALAVARSLASPSTIRRVFFDDERASAQVAAAHRRRSISLMRLRT